MSDRAPTAKKAAPKKAKPAPKPGDLYTDDAYYLPIEREMERKYGLPSGIMADIRKKGEKSNRDQSPTSTGARSVYQIIPGTRTLFLNKYGVNAYAGDREAAQVAALHLKESLDRNRNSVEAAVREYHGGPDRRNWGPVNQQYVDRVMGRATAGNPKDKVSRVRGADVVNPGEKLTSADFLGRVPSDVINGKRLEPKRVTIEDARPRKSAQQIILGDRIGRDITPGNDQATIATPKRAAPGKMQQFDPMADPADVGNVAMQAQIDTEADERADAPWMTKLAVAVDENWVGNMIVRGLDQKTHEGDPNWHKQYAEKQTEYEQFAQSQDELDELRSSRAQNSEQDFKAVMQDIEARRRRQSIINSGGYGWAWNLGTSFADPVGWVATAGVGKVAQLGRVAQGGAKAATLGQNMAEGAAASLVMTAALDYSGQPQSVSDYLTATALGTSIGAAIHPVQRLLGGKDISDVEAVQRVAQDTNRIQSEIDAAALAKVGPAADEAAIEVARMEVIVDRAERVFRAGMGERADADRFLPNDIEQFRTTGKADQARAISTNNLEGITDPAEQRIAAEMAERANEIDRVAAANGSYDKGLEGIFLRHLGKEGLESDALTLLRSKSPMLRAMGVQLLESTTGAGGRKPSAAISMVLRERDYMGRMVEYDQQFDLWRKSAGIGKASALMGPDARARFDREVFREVHARADAGYVPSRNVPVVRAADAAEAGFDQMRMEMQFVKTLGNERLGDASRGYLPHRIDAAKLTEMQRSNKAQFQQVVNVMAKQFQTMNEYSYVNKAGETITKNFDAAFSKTLAARYLDEAIGRSRGSNYIPANLHSSEGASIVEDAVKAMSGIDDLEKAAILGRYSRGGPSFTKGRLNMDLSADIGGGMQLGDLFVQDMLTLYRGYARRAAGEVSLAQYGIMGKKGLQMARMIADKQGAEIKELKALERVSSEFLGEAWSKGDYDNTFRNLRSITSAVRLGGMGFTQLGELGNAIPHVGVRAVLSNLLGANRLRKEVQGYAKGGRPKNVILQSFDETNGFIGGDSYAMTRIFDQPTAGVEMYDQASITLMDKLVRGGAHMTSVFSGFRIIHAVQVRGMSEEIVKKAIRYIHLDKESKALADMGLSDDLRAALKANMADIAKFDRKGNLTELDLFAGEKLSPAHIHELAQVVERGAGQIIQRTYIGETGKWAHSEFLQFLFQFRGFGITSIEKQYGRQRANHGAIRAAAIMFGSMAFAFPIHLARVNVQAAGLSAAEREKFFEERTNVAAMTRALMNYTSVSGLLPDMLDITTAFGNKVGLVSDDYAKDVGVRGRQGSVSGLVPGVGVVDDAYRATLGGQFDKIPKLLPGANLPFVTPILNGLTQDDDEN